ncbi:MAG: YCF48-related protein [candidate division WOR-3 bacterium]|nr:YCF48-related protein [candidate division WOR-3 bacterium]
MRVIKYIFYLWLLVFGLASAYTFHGSAMAPNSLKGWVVTIDTPGVFHTPNCGLDWIRQNLITYRELADVFSLTEQKGWIASYSYGYIFYTEDGGTNWLLQVMGLSKWTNRVFFIDDSCGWVACRGAMLGRTNNGGQNWEQIFLPYPPFRLDSVDMQNISFIDRAKGWFCAGRYPEYRSWPGETCYTKGQGYIAKSTDGGLNWQLLLKDTIYDFFDVKFQDSLNGFVVGGNDRTMSAIIMRTANGGNTWQTITIPWQTKYLRALEFISPNRFWAVGHNGTILYSCDAGNSWTLQQSNVNATLYDVDFADSLYGLVAGDSYVLYTHNAGQTWSKTRIGIRQENTSYLVMENQVEIYPNPASSHFAIRFSSHACPLRVDCIRIYDVTGNVIKVQEFKDGKVQKISLDGIKCGVYFVKIGNQLIRKKLIVIK